MRAFLILLASTVAASQFETQHALDFTVPVPRKLDVLLHMRLRTRPTTLGLYQARGGPVFSYDFSDRVSLLGGYYFAQEERSGDPDLIAGHRLFGGLESGIKEGRRYSLDARALYERFLPERAPNFNRYRLRLRLSAKALVAPYTSQEVFFDNLGYRSARFAGGVRWKLRPTVELDFGYFYEARAARLGPGRHMWLTSLHFKRSAKPGDPDL